MNENDYLKQSSFKDIVSSECMNYSIFWHVNRCLFWL